MSHIPKKAFIQTHSVYLVLQVQLFTYILLLLLCAMNIFSLFLKNHKTSKLVLLHLNKNSSSRYFQSHMCNIFESCIFVCIEDRGVRHLLCLAEPKLYVCSLLSTYFHVDTGKLYQNKLYISSNYHMYYYQQG